MNLKNEQRINFLTKEARSAPPSFIYYDDFAKNLGTLPLLNYYSNDNYQKILIAVSLGGNNLLYQDMKQNNNTQLILEPK